MIASVHKLNYQSNTFDYLVGGPYRKFKYDGIDVMPTANRLQSRRLSPLDV